MINKITSSTISSTQILMLRQVGVIHMDQQDLKELANNAQIAQICNEINIEHHMAKLT